MVRREDVRCTRGIPGDTCRFISGGICSVCSGILGGVSRDTSEPKPLLIATLRRDLSLKDTLSRCCALVGPQRWLMHRNLHLETDFHYIPGTRTRNNHFFTVESSGNGHRIWKNARQCTKLLETTVFKMKGQIQQMPKNRSKKCVLHDIKNKSRIKEQQSRMTGSGRNSLYRPILAYLVKPKNSAKEMDMLHNQTRTAKDLEKHHQKIIEIPSRAVPDGVVFFTPTIGQRDSNQPRCYRYIILGFQGETVGIRGIFGKHPPARIPVTTNPNLHLHLE